MDPCIVKLMLLDNGCKTNDSLPLGSLALGIFCNKDLQLLYDDLNVS